RVRRVRRMWWRRRVRMVASEDGGDVHRAGVGVVVEGDVLMAEVAGGGMPGRPVEARGEVALPAEREGRLARHVEVLLDPPAELGDALEVDRRPAGGGHGEA